MASCQNVMPKNPFAIKILLVLRFPNPRQPGLLYNFTVNRYLLAIRILSHVQPATLPDELTFVCHRVHTVEHRRSIELIFCYQVPILCDLGFAK